MAQGQRRQALLTADMVRAFMGACGELAPSTIWHYRTVLRAFEALCPELPRSPAEVASFVRDLRSIADGRRALAVMTRRSYYKALQAFYAWSRANRDLTLPRLPYESFGRKKRKFQ